MGNKEAMLIYKINEKGSPVELPNIIDIKQKGTSYGPKLCAMTTTKVNCINRKSITKIRDITIESLIFVDDIMFPSSIKPEKSFVIFSITNEYKYLGKWYSSVDHHSESIKKR